MINTKESVYSIDCAEYTPDQILQILKYYESLNIKWASGDHATSIPDLHNRRYLIFKYSVLKYGDHNDYVNVVPTFRLNKLKRILDK